VVTETLTPGDAHAQDALNTTVFYHADHVGSPQAVSKSSDATGELIRYDVFGKTRGIYQKLGTVVAVENPPDASTSLGYTGHEPDEATGLVYFGVRHLDPIDGHFLSVDPARQYASPYVHGNYDPLNGRDADGGLFSASIDRDLIRSVASSFVAGFVGSSQTGGGGLDTNPSSTAGVDESDTGSTTSSGAERSGGFDAPDLQTNLDATTLPGGSLDGTGGDVAATVGGLGGKAVAVESDAVGDLGARLQGIAYVAGAIASGFIPRLGELQDMEVLRDPSASLLSKVAAGFSLGINSGTTIPLPNAGSLIRATDAAKTADKATTAGKRTFSAADRAAGLEKAKDASGIPRCQYCGTKLDPRSGRANSYEADHTAPYSRGGPSTAENLTPSCRTCNRSKGARTPDEWGGP
jgi:RHS repeat-associated protein